MDVISRENIQIMAGFATCISVALSALALYIQNRNQWRLHSASLATTLDESWDKNEMRAKRREFATILDNHYNGLAVIDHKSADQIDGPVMLFLEHLALLVRLRAIDKEIVWNTFGWFYVGYYFCLTKEGNLLALHRQEQEDDSMWEEFEWFAMESIKIYKKKGAFVEKNVDSRIRSLIAYEMKWIDGKR